MPYCTKEDIEARFKNFTFTATSSVTVDDVNTFIEDYSTAIDARIGKAFVTPVDTALAPKSAQVLKLICVMLVTAAVEDIIQPPAPGAINRAPGYRKDAETWLASIETGTLDLEDGTRRTNTFGSGVTVAVASYSTAPTFKRGVRQW